jgi:polysaccharide biosynthesis transport protein
MLETTPAHPAEPASGRPGAHQPHSGFHQSHGFTPDQDVHVLDRLAVLYKYRRIVISVFVLIMIVMMMGQFTAVPMYRAVAQIQIDDERSTSVPGIANQDVPYWDDPDTYLNTQLKLLGGRDLARRVVKKLDLGSVPEYNGQGPKPLGIRSAFAAIRDRVRGQVPQSAAPPSRAAGFDESGAAGAFASHVAVEPVRGTRLVNVSVTSLDPAFAPKAVNALVEEYVSQNLESKLSATQGALTWLSAELARQQEKVTQSERALAEYRERQNAISLDDKNNIVVSRLTQLNESVTRAKTERLQKESVYSQIKALGTSNAGAENLAIVAGNPDVQTRKTQLNDLMRQKVAMSERLGAQHPDMKAMDGKIVDARQQLDVEIARTIQRIKNDYESALMNERELARTLEDQKNAAMDLSKKGVEYQVLVQKAESDRQVYNSLLQRQKELDVQSNSKANNVRVVERAEEASAWQPSAQRRWLLALVVALCASIGLAFAMDYLNDTIKTPEDLTRRLKLPFLGLVPSVRGNDHPILSSQVPADFGEAFRALRTSLVSTFAGETTRTILVTSAQPLEGKTTTAANIAIALAFGGARVLLIDADMRRPGVQRTLKLPNEKGLSHLLVGQSRFREVIQRTQDPNLLVITAGRTPQNPSELLSSERMKALLGNLSTGPFDWVIVDTPPVLAVTDAVILAPLVSGALFVVGAEMTRRRLAERAVETLVAGKPRVMGAVLNRVDFARNRYYYSRYYGYQHKSYYAEAAV